MAMLVANRRGPVDEEQTSEQVAVVFEWPKRVGRSTNRGMVAVTSISLPSVYDDSNCLANRRV